MSQSIKIISDCFSVDRWEEEKEDDGVKWKFLEHRGPLLAPPYEPLPDNVKFYYDGKPMKLEEATEEVATFYGRMLDHDYTTKEVFNRNFFKDWRKVMLIGLHLGVAFTVMIMHEICTAISVLCKEGTCIMHRMSVKY